MSSSSSSSSSSSFPLLVKPNQICQHAAEIWNLRAWCSFSVTLTPVLYSAVFVPVLSLSPVSVFSSHVLLSEVLCSLLKSSQHFSLCFPFPVSIVIFLHLVPCDAISSFPSLHALPPLPCCCSTWWHVKELLHTAGWNLTWQMPWLLQDTKRSFRSSQLEITLPVFPLRLVWRLFSKNNQLVRSWKYLALHPYKTFSIIQQLNYETEEINLF